MPIELVMLSNHLILCCPLLFLPPIPPSIRVFSNESTLCMKWPKYWSFSFSISPSSEHPGLMCFRMDWLHLLAVQGTLKSLLQHHSSKASIFRLLAFFTVQLSHPYMTTGKAIALTRWTFIGNTFLLTPLIICGQADSTVQTWNNPYGHHWYLNMADQIEISKLMVKDFLVSLTLDLILLLFPNTYGPNHGLYKKSLATVQEFLKPKCKKSIKVFKYTPVRDQ